MTRARDDRPLKPDELRRLAARSTRRLFARLAEDLDDIAEDLGEDADSVTVGQLLADAVRSEQT